MRSDKEKKTSDKNIYKSARDTLDSWEQYQKKKRRISSINLNIKWDNRLVLYRVPFKNAQGYWLDELK